jgi:hypothetical protein
MPKANTAITQRCLLWLDGGNIYKSDRLIWKFGNGTSHDPEISRRTFVYFVTLPLRQLHQHQIRIDADRGYVH